MSQFRYKAVTSAGEVIEGSLDALSLDAAIKQLRDLGHLPIHAEESKESSIAELLNKDVFGSGKVSKADVADITRELATLLRAEVELDRSIEIIASFSHRRPVRTLLTRALEDIRGGMSLGDALSRHERSFSRFYVSMVRAGEAGGTLAETLERLAEYLERSRETAEQVKSALIYPAILMAMAILSIVVLVTVVLPEFKPLFEGTGKKLPWETRLIMDASEILRDGWWVFLAALASAVLVIHRLARIPNVRLRWDRNVTRIPLIGTVLRDIEVARLSRTLGTLLKNGVPVVPVLEILEATAQNLVVRQRIFTVTAAVKQGRGLADTLASSMIFPERATHLLHVGEESGRLEPMLLKIGEIYEGEAERGIRRTMALLTPALTLLLGAFIAGIIVSMFVAILSVNEIAL